jgi:hypothetical protein
VTFVLPKQISFYNSGILDSFFTVTIFNVWTTQTIYFGTMSTWHSAFHQKVDHNFYYIGKTTSGPFLTHRQILIVENINVWNGRGIFYVTYKRLILLFWNYRKFDRYRSWNSRIISLHSWSTRHTISQKQNYMVSVIPVITYAISTFWHKRSNS